MEESRLMQPTSIGSFAYNGVCAGRTQDYNNKEDLGAVYAEIMTICQPFYELPENVSSDTCYIAPRLEDGIFIESISYEQDNPQDPTAACFNSEG
jgi:hypothetical protein